MIFSVAYRTDFNWLWKSSFKLRTLLVYAFKDGKGVALVYSFGASNEDPEDLHEGTAIVESLTFQ